MKNGTVFNIMKYSIHDGPGIRTTVFLKGCPLQCWWCHNPESQAFHPEIMFWQDKCIGCEKCLHTCPANAISLEDGIFSFAREKCISCGKCSEVCPTGAREIVGNEMTVDEVLEEIDKDLIFYDDSGGGVTFSGGEALMQPEFLKILLKQCREKEIHTAVETCGFVKTEHLQAVANHVDLFLYDLKLFDDEKHKKYTGVSNQLILNNLRQLARIHNNIIVRIPIIPGVNDDEENIIKAAKFILSLQSVKEIHLLPYHKAGVDKYQRLDKSYRLPDINPPEPENMNRIAQRLKGFGFRTKIGG